MKTAGQILQSARLEKKLEIEDISRITKIRRNFLTSIESDDYSHLPSGATARGFIRNYSEFLGLNPDHVLAIFRRDFIENQLGRIIPRGMAEPVVPVSFWTPKTTVIALVVLIFTIFGIYLTYQYRLLTGPPSLTLSQPQDKIIVSDPNLLISGRTDPEATISVNGQLITLDKGGHFSLRLPLQLGSNHITITSVAKSGKSSILTRTVTLR